MSQRTSDRGRTVVLHVMAEFRVTGVRLQSESYEPRSQATVKYTYWSRFRGYIVAKVWQREEGRSLMVGFQGTGVRLQTTCSTYLAVLACWCLCGRIWGRISGLSCKGGRSGGVVGRRHLVLELIQRRDIYDMSLLRILTAYISSRRDERAFVRGPRCKILINAYRYTKRLWGKEWNWHYPLFLRN